MAKLLLAIVIGIVGAGIVHILVIFAMPELAKNNAWGRFSGIADLFQVVRVAPLRSDATRTIGTASDREAFAFVDPAFLTASCRFSLADGPVRMLASAAGTTFWSASVYNRQGDNLYSINDRSAVDGAFDLLVGTRDQLVDAMANTAETESTTIPVEVALQEGYMTLRALVDEESRRRLVESFVASLRCAPERDRTASSAVPSNG